MELVATHVCTKKLAVESGSAPLTIPKTKFEAISSKDVRGDRFQAKIYASKQILYHRPSNF